MSKVTASKILDVAIKEIGTKATNVKKCKYNTWFYGSAVSGSQYDWCAAFICWLFAQAGASDMIPVKSAGCGVLASGFNNKGKFYKSGFKPGDIVFFHWSNSMSGSVPGAYTLDHVGIIEKCNSDGTYTTIEGNTGNTSNGEVMRRTRSASVISGVARPDYITSTTTKEAEEMIEFGKTNIATLAFKKQLITLYNMGIIKTKVDNSAGFGKGTLQAVKEAQKAGKVTVDGIVGEKTINAIYHLINDCNWAKDKKITAAKKALA